MILTELFKNSIHIMSTTDDFNEENSTICSTVTDGSKIRNYFPTPGGLFHIFASWMKYDI